MVSGVRSVADRSDVDGCASRLLWHGASDGVAFVYGQATPDPKLFGVMDGVFQTFDPYGTVLTDCFHFFDFTSVGSSFGKPPVGWIVATQPWFLPVRIRVKRVWRVEVHDGGHLIHGDTSPTGRVRPTLCVLLRRSGIGMLRCLATCSPNLGRAVPDQSSTPTSRSNSEKLSSESSSMNRLTASRNV